MRLIKRLQVQINEELYDWVKTHAYQHHISMSQMLRELLNNCKASQQRKERKIRRKTHVSEDQLTLF